MADPWEVKQMYAADNPLFQDPPVLAEVIAEHVRALAECPVPLNLATVKVSITAPIPRLIPNPDEPDAIRIIRVSAERVS